MQHAARPSGLTATLVNQADPSDRVVLDLDFRDALAVPLARPPE
jgi:hypothetical protein